MRTVPHRLGPVLVACLLPLLLSTCEANSGGPVAGSSIEVTPATGFSFSAIGATQQLTAVVKNQSGTVVANAVVAWKSSDAAVVAVSATGLATAMANGSAQLTATSGSASVDVPVTVAQMATLVTKFSGDLQTDTVGQVLAQPVVVLVRDAVGHVVADASVTFAVTVGSGALGTASTTTDAAGRAQTTWTLGTGAGNQSVSATVGTLPALSFTATATAGAPAIIAKQAGDGQTAVTGQAVPVRPAVIVRDAYNNLKSGATVTFAATAANGVVTAGVQVTNALGIATVGSWTLGVPGTDTLTATVAGIGNPAVFTATTQTATVVAFVGNNQKGLVGQRVNVRPAVRVTNGGGNPVPGAAVTFAVTSGGGALTNGVAITNANGVAQVGSWTLGGSAGINAMTATVGGTAISGNPVAFADTGVSQAYTIELQYYGPTPSVNAQAAFFFATSKWQSIIYQHVGAPVLINRPAGACGAGEPATNRTVNDLLILATLDEIDGPGGILGFAGPCVARANGLAVMGVMVFDTADVAGLISSGRLNAVILHEMGHVLGLGTPWAAPTNCLLLKSDNPAGSGTVLDTYFGCPKARAAFDSIGGANYTGGNKVPVENCGTAPYVAPFCGQGTVNSHWREVVFNNELMTGYINAGTNPLSILSIAAQEDIGYTVNYSAADPYTRIFMAPKLGGGTPPFSLGDDIRHGPIFVVDDAGTVVRVILNR